MSRGHRAQPPDVGGTRLRMDELVNAWIGDRDTPFQMGLLAIFDAGPFTRDGGEVDTERIVAELSRRALGVPELGRRVIWTRPGEGRPLWLDVPDADVTCRVGTATLDDATDLFTWASNRSMRRLPRDEPLWRAEVVTLADARFAVLVVVHHLLVDGLAGMRLLVSLLDGEPDAARPPTPARRPTPVPNHRELLRIRLRSRGRPARPVAGRGEGLAQVARKARAEYREARSAFTGAPPRTSLPRRVGARRRTVVAFADLETLRAAGHARGATVNDLLLAAVTRGLRDLFTARGECRDTMCVRTIVPVAADPSGQAASMMVLDLPVGVGGSETRLARIVEQTSARKERLRITGGSGINLLALPVPVARVVIPWARRRGSTRIALSVTNVPGPPAPLWLAGARLVQAVPIPPLVPLVGLTVAALSYDGRLAVTVNADGSIDDLAILGDGIAQSFAGL